MTLETDRATIEGRFQTQMASLASLTPIAWENVPFRLAASDTEFVELLVLPATDTNTEIGSHINFRRHGEVRIRVNVKEGTGTKRARDLEDNITSIFRNQEVSGIQFFEAQYEGDSPLNGWIRSQVVVPYFSTIRASETLATL